MTLCLSCGVGPVGVKRPLQACAMAMLACPSMALRPARMMFGVSEIFAISTPSPNEMRRVWFIPSVVRRGTGLSRCPRSSLSASPADGAKEAAMAAIETADKTLEKVSMTREGDAAAASGSEVEATVSAARAAARAAMDSLRRGEVGDGGGLGEDGAEDGMRAFASRQAILSPARAAVEAALAAVAGAESDAPVASRDPARDAIRLARAALDRHDSAVADLEASSASSARDSYAGAASRGGSEGDREPSSPRREDVDTREEEGEEEEEEEEEPTKEPESAQRTRNNPAASHGQLAHLLWRQVAGRGDTVVDCTAGNGHDTLELGRIVGLADGVGKLYCIDIQDAALEATREKLATELGDGALERSILLKGNFRDFPPELDPMSVQLIVYNLGWLPGGDKSITTMVTDTLESIERAKVLVKSGGMISVMCYRGHEEGSQETEALLEYAQGMTHFLWRVYVHERVNRPGAPLLITMYRL